MVYCYVRRHVSCLGNGCRTTQFLEGFLTISTSLVENRTNSTLEASSPFYWLWPPRPLVNLKGKRRKSLQLFIVSTYCWAASSTFRAALGCWIGNDLPLSCRIALGKRNVWQSSCSAKSRSSHEEEASSCKNRWNPCHQSETFLYVEKTAHLLSG